MEGFVIYDLLFTIYDFFVLQHRRLPRPSASQ